MCGEGEVGGKGGEAQGVGGRLGFGDYGRDRVAESECVELTVLDAVLGVLRDVRGRSATVLGWIRS